jgi:multidrug resistance efflux pump
LIPNDYRQTDDKQDRAMVFNNLETSRTRLTAINLVQSSRRAWWLANVLLFLLVLTSLAMFFVPWQQSAKGSGKVVAYVPQERQQTVISATEGIVVKIAEGLREGSRVHRGEVILELEPSSANLRQHLEGQVLSLRTKLDTAETKEAVYRQNILDFQEAQFAAVQAAEELVAAANDKLEAERELLSGYTAKERQSRLNYQRQKGLADQGIKPQVEIEKLVKDWDVAKADMAAQAEKIEAAAREWEAKKNERIQKEREAKTKVDYSRAMAEDARGQVASIEKEIQELEIKLGELDRLTIEAPRDGTLFRMPIFERGQMVKKGDALFTLVPDTTERVVELWIAGNDMPLIRSGEHVRLQFEGWPAVQFAGWPSVAVGTFGGEVASVDPADNGQGLFRVQVKEVMGEGWPDDRFLRQGVRANGWVMLNRVPLGYEMWRQLNGFPPTVSDTQAASKLDKGRVPKLK